MRVRTKHGAMLIAGVLATAGGVRAQEMKMPAQEQHHQMNIPVVKPEYPRMGRAQEDATGTLVALEQVEKIAGESNPTFRQADAVNLGAKARLHHACLPPIPPAAYQRAPKCRNCLDGSLGRVY